ncbi:MAG: hypothetical protein IPP99_04015 [Chitinophagaceae bacterium]|nr:hypothetical protein [Chitinophagaceae bacterium]
MFVGPGDPLNSGENAGDGNGIYCLASTWFPGGVSLDYEADNITNDIDMWNVWSVDGSKNNLDPVDVIQTALGTLGFAGTVPETMLYSKLLPGREEKVGGWEII